MKHRTFFAMVVTAIALGCNAQNPAVKLAPTARIEIFSISGVSGDNTKETVNPYSGETIFLVQPPIITNVDVDTVATIRENMRDENGNPIQGDKALQINLTPSGAAKLREVSINQVGKQLAFVVNGMVFSTPTILAPIDTSLVISGKEIDKILPTLTGISAPQ